MSESVKFRCSRCHKASRNLGSTSCYSKDPLIRSSAPPSCPSNTHPHVIEETIELYSGTSPDAKMANVAAKVEGLCYKQNPRAKNVRPGWTRVEDTIAFAKSMGYTKIGIASCVGLLDETNRFSQILEAQGLTPLSLCCKVGSIDKRKLNLREEDKIRPGSFESACNPVAQAKLLNAADTDMNVIMGLCIGHDMLFTKYSKAPVTTLVVKDRVTGHNPVSVLYGQNYFFRRLLTQSLEIEDFTGD